MDKSKKDKSCESDKCGLTPPPKCDNGKCSVNPPSTCDNGKCTIKPVEKSKDDKKKKTK